MLRHLIACFVVITAMPVWPVLRAQAFPGKGLFRLLSAYQEDPLAGPSIVEWIKSAEIGYDRDGRRILRGPHVRILDEDRIYRKDPKTSVYQPIAWNPWPAPLANAQGEFDFADESRFPVMNVERNPDGSAVRRDGLQVWSPLDLHLGMNTAFAAAHDAKTASESWAGRSIDWGQFGVLELNTHSFTDLQAFYSPSARGVYFGLVLYRLPGETDIRVFETASSWEIAAHESGHAVQHALKPNAAPGDLGSKTWGESFGDQVAMWAALRDTGRVQNLLDSTQGNLNSSNSLSRLCEMFNFLVGKTGGMRDAFHDKKVSDTDEEVHDRSEVFTGAAYRIFVAIYDALRGELDMREALQVAGQIMGVFLTHAMDYTPENHLTLEDVAKAYLKIDKEFFEGYYQTLLVNEFLRREIFHPGSVIDWLAHEASLPGLEVPAWWPDEKIEEFILAQQSALGIGPEFGLTVQSITRTGGPAMWPALQQTIVRIQLTERRGDESVPLDNHGILVFRADGTLADYHSPLPGELNRFAADYFTQVQAVAAIRKARQLRMSPPGAPLALVRGRDGRITVESRVVKGEGLNAYVEVFTPDSPRGERREILVPPFPRHKLSHVVDIQ